MCLDHILGRDRSTGRCTDAGVGNLPGRPKEEITQIPRVQGLDTAEIQYECEAKTCGASNGPWAVSKVRAA